MEVALPEDGGYIDGSFKLSSETLKMFADMPGEEGSAQAGTVQMEAAECCPYCEGENVFPNWDTAKQGYIAKCQTCGEQIMLCDECMRATTPEDGVTGMRKYMATKRGASVSVA